MLYADWAPQKRHAINDAASQTATTDAPADGGSAVGRRTTAAAGKRRKVSVVEEPLRL